MTQYRKKPIIIEAVQFNGLNPTEIKNFVGESCEVEIYDNKVTPPIACIVIHNFEGDMEVNNGDYVIKGEKGEFYPCEPDIFEQIYESAETQQQMGVDLNLEKEIDDWYNTMGIPVTADALKETARHFAEWGAIYLNTRKEE